MTELDNLTLSSDILNPILQEGLPGLPEAVSLLINAAMLVERERHLGAGPYQRDPARTGHANDFKDRRLDTRLGCLELRVPQTRNTDTPFLPTALERGQRCEKALSIAVAEMYLQGVSSRRVTSIVEKLCGLQVTSTAVSRAAAELDDMFETWRNRPIPPIAHLILDARYENLRVETPSLQAGESATVTVDLTNTGRRAGVEIAQLYLADELTSVTWVQQTLKAYQRVALEPGETKTVRFEVPYEAFSLVNAEAQRVVEPGWFEILVGPSSRRKGQLSARLEVVAS